MLCGRTVASLTLCLSVFVPARVEGQPPPAPLVNPRAIEFDLPAAGSADVTGYRVELFKSGSDTTSASPVRSLNIRKPRGRSAQLRVDLRELLGNVPDGEYVATVRAVGRHGNSPRSLPTEPFTISGHGQPVDDLPAPAPSPDPEVADPDREPWGWTVAGIAMGVAAFLLGYLFR
jgi:hypothetical protein